MKRLKKLSDAGKSDLFRKYIPLTRNLSRKFVVKYNLEYQNTLNEAESALALCVTRWNEMYDPNKKSEMSWIYQFVNYQLLDMVRNQNKVKELTFSSIKNNDSNEMESSIENEIEARRTPWLENIMKTLGEDAKIVVRTIVNAPHDIADHVSKSAHKFPWSARRGQALIKDCLDDMGWSKERIDRAWTEIQSCL